MSSRSARNGWSLQVLLLGAFLLCACGDDDAPARDPAAWEIALPNGAYDVTVAVGDPAGE